MPRTKVFISYSHKDSRWLERLQVHLKPLEREGIIDRWDDTRIKAGAHWKAEIEQALSSAKVAVLLVSADFLASDFIADDELPPLLAAAESEGMTILSVNVRSGLFERSELARLQAFNPPDKPLDLLSKPKADKELKRLAETIADAVMPVTKRLEVRQPAP